ncbi:pentatricopeptide repeat-containing protein At3g22470, mitochondrial-like [Durio zibethinus]|uniref:Pentatricopeptide repeat-containing protein At3g22470, mitochondrial-like n=1 Tax=Durio zibethinus TaxID=66656 RepID=A0A6P6AHJ8_DURZI|nr:pentatricopeptide repeat-containing protein At3g22470, mitochondrial-like [Durio zibethinus]
MDGYCLRGEMDEARKVFNSITNKGCTPDVVSYSIIINGYCKAKRIEEAETLFHEMTRSGLIPNVVTFSTLINGMSQTGRLAVAQEIFKEMYAYGLVPDVIAYSSLLYGLCRHGHINEALGFFRAMLTIKGVHPSVYTYSTMIKGLCKEGLLNEAYELFRKMEADGCMRDSCSYNTMIQGCLHNNDISQAIQILHEMVQKGFSADASAAAMVVDLLWSDSTVPNWIVRIHKVKPPNNGGESFCFPLLADLEMDMVVVIVVEVLWMVRIGGGEFPIIKESDYLVNGEFCVDKDSCYAKSPSKLPIQLDTLDSHPFELHVRTFPGIIHIDTIPILPLLEGIIRIDTIPILPLLDYSLTHASLFLLVDHMSDTSFELQFSIS